MAMHELKTNRAKNDKMEELVGFYFTFFHVLIERIKYVF